MARHSRKLVPSLVGFGRKASSQLCEGCFKVRSPVWVEEGEKESADGPENDIRTATATTRSVTRLSKRTVFSTKSWPKEKHSNFVQKHVIKLSFLNKIRSSINFVLKNNKKRKIKI